MSDSVRLDKWLWAARFYKTRALATEAINGGHVHLNGNRPKPSKAVQPGDELVIRRGPETYQITVDALTVRRGPATEARKLYREAEESYERRQQEREQRRLEAAAQPQTARRPDKQGRRKIIRFINKFG
jgi:ribosome-associated heat shock protein Hsp15